MTIQEALEKLQGYEKATFALNHATGLMYYDGATIAPKGTAELRGSTLGELSRMGYELTTAPETVEMLQTLVQAQDRLDPVTARQVMQDFVRVNREMGITILLNIHHVELALEYADRVIGIRAGKIVYDGPSYQVDQGVLDAIYGERDAGEASV